MLVAIERRLSAVFVFSIVILLTAGILAGVHPAAAQQPGILGWRDNFDSYASGSFPNPPWQQDGNATDTSTNYVDDSICHSAPNSLRLYGIVGGDWASLTRRPVNASAPFEVSLAVYNGTESLSGAHPNRGGCGLREGSSWENPFRWLIQFMGDGTIQGTTGATIGTYNTAEWYVVNMIYRRPTPSAVTVAYYINGSYVTTLDDTAQSSEDDLTNFEIFAQEGSAWYDDISVTPLEATRFDFNSDGKDDLLWQNSQTGQLCVWDMNGTSYSASSGLFATVPTAWKVKGVADINADGHPDLLFWNSNTGQMLFWEMNGAAGTTLLSAGSVFATAPPPWQPVSMADFDGDGNPDILFENPSTGQLVVWYMNGQSVKSSSGIFKTLPDATWQVAGTADFNQDGHPDILLENSKTGACMVWYMGGTGGTTVMNVAPAFATVPPPWQIVSTGDVNGDGHPDLTWHNSTTGQTLVWLMGGALGTTKESQGPALPNSPLAAWNVVGVR